MTDTDTVAPPGKSGPKALMAEPAELDARITAAFSKDADSDDVRCVLADV
jgi:hypothetical protein